MIHPHFSLSFILDHALDVSFWFIHESFRHELFWHCYLFLNPLKGIEKIATATTTAAATTTIIRSHWKCRGQNAVFIYIFVNL